MKHLITLFTIFFNGALLAQHNPVSFNISQSSDTIIFDAVIEDGWHMYAVHLPNPNEGPLPTEFIIDSTEHFNLVEPVIEEEGHTEMDDAFGIEVKYFEKNVTFKQPIKVLTQEEFHITGTISYMVCNDQMCIPFDVPLNYSFLKD